MWGEVKGREREREQKRGEVRAVDVGGGKR
jgi:hypothetical protein